MSRQFQISKEIVAKGTRTKSQQGLELFLTKEAMTGNAKIAGKKSFVRCTMQNQLISGKSRSAVHSNKELWKSNAVMSNPMRVRTTPINHPPLLP